jgi:hypothetical protein
MDYDIQCEEFYREYDFSQEDFQDDEGDEE